MVAVIHSSSSLHRALNYNEQKEKQGVAKCLAAVNYPKEAAKMNFYQKLNRLTKQASLNARTTVNSVHISLNFDPSEKLSEAALQKIAATYMDKIGFGKQPYLVYQHTDAGHPHIHIVSTNIKPDGKRIELHNLGKNQSTKARREIENEFGLVKADKKKLELAFQLQAVNAQRLQYGKSETRRAIANVLNQVLNNYHFTSLPEFNAVLKGYNIVADRGSENSRTFKRNGLFYRVLDEKGNKTGVPIKASILPSKPTLKTLGKHFEKGEAERQPHKQRLKTVIDWTLNKGTFKDMEQLSAALQREQVSVVLRQSKEGFLYGITFVDHKTKCVFNGSDLGKEYSAKALQQRCGQVITEQPKKQLVNKPLNTSAKNLSNSGDNNKSIADILLTPKNSLDFIPQQLKAKKKRKRKRIYL